MKHLAFIIIISFFISCRSKKENSFSGNKIIFVTDCYSNWIEADKKTSHEESIKYGTKLMDSLFNTYFSECEYADGYNYYMADTSSGFINMQSLRKTIDSINSKQETIKNRINRALLKCQNYLPYDGLSIFIFPSLDSTLAEKLGGVGGFTVGSKHITITIDPFAKGWEKQLEIITAHEFHHAYWTKLNFNSMEGTFRDRLIFEGKAEAFSHIIYPEIKAPWDSTLSEIQKKELWNKVKNKLENTDFVWQDSIMFGIKNYPLCGGYILGRNIVETYLKKEPNMQPKNWTNFSAKYILERSGYK